MRFFGVGMILICLVTATGAMDVFVSIPPQAMLLEALAGEHVAVHVLVKPGDNPHTFEPSPRQMMTLGQARLYFLVKMPFEAFITSKLVSVAGILEMSDCTAGIKRRVMADDHDHAHHADSDADYPDPHVWMNPENLVIMADNMAKALKVADPVHGDVYETNRLALIARIQSADAEIRQVLLPLKGQTFYVYHPAFGYFGDRYGLIQRAVETGGKSPTPRQLSNLISQARNDGVKIIFVQAQFDRRAAATVASAIGGTVVPINPLARDILAELRKLADEVRAAVKDS